MYSSGFQQVFSPPRCQFLTRLHNSAFYFRILCHNHSFSPPSPPTTTSEVVEKENCFEASPILQFKSWQNPSSSFPLGGLICSFFILKVLWFQIKDIMVPLRVEKMWKINSLCGNCLKWELKLGEGGGRIGDVFIMWVRPINDKGNFLLLVSLAFIDCSEGKWLHLCHKLKEVEIELPRM